MSLLRYANVHIIVHAESLPHNERKEYAEKVRMRYVLYVIDIHSFMPITGSNGILASNWRR